MAYEPPASLFRIDTPLIVPARAPQPRLARHSRLGLGIAAGLAFLLALAMHTGEAHAAAPLAPAIAPMAASR